MAAPSFVQAGTGQVSTTTAVNASVNTTVGNVIICAIMQDGTSAGEPFDSVDASVEDLAGTNNTLTKIGAFDVGNPAAAKLHIYIGRSIASPATCRATANSVGGDDCYIRVFDFSNVSTGTTLATVIENSTAGSTTNGAGTSTTVSDSAVTTIGTDRLAVNFGGINDDATGIAVFTGMTGGTWTDFQSFESSTGTDGTVFFEDCVLTSAGTIDGGSDTITSDGWGVVGFALIGTTAASTETFEDRYYLQAVNRSSIY